MTTSVKYFKIRLRCIQCGNEIVSGRPDRKFCCEKCKNRYHNRQRYPLRQGLETAVLRVLDKNHAILDRLYKMGVTSIDLITLSNLEFDPHFVTSYRRAGRRQVFAVFDMQYELTSARLKNLQCLSEKEEDGE